MKNKSPTTQAFAATLPPIVGPRRFFFAPGRHTRPPLVSPRLTMATTSFSRFQPDYNAYGFFNTARGSGKTSLCFELSTLYAKQNPEDIVVVIDLCPQADLSVALLGGCNGGHDYVDTADEQVECIGRDVAPTLYQYLAQVAAEGESLCALEPYLVRASTRNPLVPPNLVTMVGSRRTSTLCTALATLGADLHNHEDYARVWKLVRTSLRRSLDALSHKYHPKDLCVFIDIPSTFGILAEIGVVACTELIVPVMCDSRARTNLILSSLSHIYEHALPHHPSSYFLTESFAYLAHHAHENHIKLPSLLACVTVCGSFGSVHTIVAKTAVREAFFDLHTRESNLFSSTVNGDSLDDAFYHDVGRFGLHVEEYEAVGRPMFAVGDDVDGEHNPIDVANSIRALVDIL